MQRVRHVLIAFAVPFLDGGRDGVAAIEQRPDDAEERVEVSLLPEDDEEAHGRPWASQDTEYTRMSVFVVVFSVT